MSNGMFSMWAKVAEHYRSVTGATAGMTPDKILNGVIDGVFASRKLVSSWCGFWASFDGSAGDSTWTVPSSALDVGFVYFHTPNGRYQLLRGAGNTKWSAYQTYSSSTYSTWAAASQLGSMGSFGVIDAGFQLSADAMRLGAFAASHAPLYANDPNMYGVLSGGKFYEVEMKSYPIRSSVVYSPARNILYFNNVALVLSWPSEWTDGATVAVGLDRTILYGEQR